MSCAEPFFRGLIVPPSMSRAEYRELVVRTTRAGQPTGVTFLLRDLDYAPATMAGAVHGEGWFNPERDESLAPFRWISHSARSLVFVPSGGARLTLWGWVPPRLDAIGINLEVRLDGRAIERKTLHGMFRLTMPLPAQERSFRVLTIKTDRFFVPHHVQKNGDMRELSLRIYGFNVQALGR
jgi:hypothetical protein